MMQTKDWDSPVLRDQRNEEESAKKNEKQRVR